MVVKENIEDNFGHKKAGVNREKQVELEKRFKEWMVGRNKRCPDPCMQSWRERERERGNKLWIRPPPN